MEWGMPTLIECDTVEQNAALCGRLGLDFVELNRNLPICQVPLPMRAGDKSRRRLEAVGCMDTKQRVNLAENPIDRKGGRPYE